MAAIMKKVPIFLFLKEKEKEKENTFPV